MSSPTEWYASLPPLTRAYGTGVVVATVGAKFGLISPYALLLSWPAVTQKLQVCELWRASTQSKPLLYMYSLDEETLSGEQLPSEQPRPRSSGASSLASSTRAT